MATGLLIGGVLGIGVIAGIKVGGVPLLVAIGLGKLTFLGALGLMGAGATMRRLALREERRRVAALPRPNEKDGDPGATRAHDVPIGIPSDQAAGVRRSDASE